MIQQLALLATIFIGTSCSLLKSTALKSSASVINDGSGQINHEGNWSFFSHAAPANLTMLEGLWYADKNNTELLGLLVKGYAGYAYGVSETMALDEQLSDKEDLLYTKQALWHYTKAYDYGIQFFSQKGISKDQIIASNAVETLPELLDKNLKRADLVAAFYFAQSWGGLINLQRTNVALMAQLASVKAIIDWVCKKDPEFEYGACHLFYAIYEAGRPAMIGGNLKKGQQIFINMIKKYPYNLLARVSYIQYFIIPTMDEVLYAKESEYLKRELLNWENSLNLGTRNQESIKYVKHSQYNLFNSIAKKRFKIIEKYKDDIF